MPRGKRKLAVAAGKQKQLKSSSSTAKAKISLSVAKRRRTFSGVSSPVETTLGFSSAVQVSPNHEQWVWSIVLALDTFLHQEEFTPLCEKLSSSILLIQRHLWSTCTRLSLSSTKRFHALLASAYAEGARSALVTHTRTGNISRSGRHASVSHQVFGGLLTGAVTISGGRRYALSRAF